MLRILLETGQGIGLTSKLSPRFDDPNLAVTGTLPHHTAWRVLLVGDEPGELMESNVISDLNSPEPGAGYELDSSGKASWNWWAGDIGPDGTAAYTTKNMEYYVDFAAQSGFPYMLLDAGGPMGVTSRSCAGQRGCAGASSLCCPEACEGVDLALFHFGDGADEGGFLAL